MGESQIIWSFTDQRWSMDFFFFFKFLVQPLVNRAKDWHDNYAFKIHFEGNQVENISTRK